MPGEQSKGTPSVDELEDIILSARYGELDEIKQFVKQYGVSPLAKARDERGNGCLHMAAANGHNDVLEFLLPLLPKETLADVNGAGNTPLHWAAMNGHLETLRILVPALPKSALFLQNQFGRTPLSEAEANAPQEEKNSSDEEPKEGEEVKLSKQAECAGYLLGFMELETMKGDNAKDGQAGEDPSTEPNEAETLTTATEKLSVASKAAPSQ